MKALETKAHIQRTGAIAILRGDYVGWFAQLARALLTAGVSAIEVTMNSPQALAGIALMRREVSAAGLIGAGTVLTAQQAEQSVNAGAQFIVAPNTSDAVIDWCVAHDVCVVPGAYTPTEIMHAYERGATCVKLFPAELGYFKAVRAPLDQVPFIPTGGVTPDNAADYIRAGAVAIGMGSALIGDYVKRENGLAEMARRAEKLMQLIRAARQTAAP
jgi:2-dehydro-3-deoxyphosphogluconate aldolase/(4S)-4-hydroxy-2-oxoglutarate aldolase